MGGRGIAAAGPVSAAAGAVEELAMLGLVAVRAQQLPVAAVGRIVVVVAVAVMDLEQLQVGVRERARATAADPRVELERLLAVALLTPGSRAASFRNDAVQAASVGC